MAWKLTKGFRSVGICEAKPGLIVIKWLFKKSAIFFLIVDETCVIYHDFVSGGNF